MQPRWFSAPPARPRAGSAALRQRLWLAVAGDVRAVQRHEFRLEVAARRRLCHEMVMAILAAHEGGTILAGELGHVSRAIADGEADAPVVRRVDPPPGAVDLDRHLLAARQEIVFGEGVAMGDLIELVAVGDVLR